VSDVSSVLIRDLILWTALYSFTGERFREGRRHRQIRSFLDHLGRASAVETEITDFVEHVPWGEEV
jgi:hypothetical protein